MMQSITQKLTKFAHFTYEFKEPRSFIVLIPIISQIIHNKQTSPLRKQYVDELQSLDPSRIKKAEKIGAELETIFKLHTVGSLARMTAGVALGIIIHPAFTLLTWEGAVSLCRTLKATEMRITLRFQ